MCATYAKANGNLGGDRLLGVLMYLCIASVCNPTFYFRCIGHCGRPDGWPGELPVWEFSAGSEADEGPCGCSRCDGCSDGRQHVLLRRPNQAVQERVYPMNLMNWIVICGVRKDLFLCTGVSPRALLFDCLPVLGINYCHSRLACGF